ncbi:MAG: flagellar assembly protein FliW [Desulfohalobiaceae bacterium]|nr:flagellar assembly protein FliW [Desulfohalobiaceae bacterium]
MKTVRTRFGDVDYHPDKTVLFPKGLLGFESLREFMVMPTASDDPLVCLQSLEDSRVAFLLVDPRRYFPEYGISLGGQEAQVLGMGREEDHCTLTMITVHSDQSVTLNLVAPVIYVPRTQRAVQIVLENTEYSVRTPLP